MVLILSDRYRKHRLSWEHRCWYQHWELTMRQKITDARIYLARLNGHLRTSTNSIQWQLEYQILHIRIPMYFQMFNLNKTSPDAEINAYVIYKTSHFR